METHEKITLLNMAKDIAMYSHIYDIAFIIQIYEDLVLAIKSNK